ncbi:AhpC/TSA family protein [Puteibacter caeruleilacunae]|nr:AhpC/TSA family protein [Puteibacter caeruleilacunae]
MNHKNLLKKSNAKGILFLLTFILALASCKEKGNFSITGKISNAETNMIYLEKLGVNKSTPVDSAKIDSDGRFTITGNVSSPQFFLLKLSEKNFVTLLLDSTEHVLVAGDAVNFSRDYIVSGSEGSDLVRELTLHLQKTNHKLDSLYSIKVSHIDATGKENEIKEWEETYKEIVEAQRKYSIDFVNKHPFSMASVLALYQKFDDQNYVIQDLQALKVAASALHSIYPNSDHVRALYENTLDLMRKQRNVNLNKLIEQAGSASPDIVLPDQNGKDVALSSLRGKYVLLHFWAAQNRASRIVNPVLVENYKRYKRKGFEIYQVSIDENRFEWVDAIDKDKLTWINVADLKGSKDALIKYNVQKLPLNYLLDPEGNIVARDLKGPALASTLKEIFK